MGLVNRFDWLLKQFWIFWKVIYFMQLTMYSQNSHCKQWKLPHIDVDKKHFWQKEVGDPDHYLSQKKTHQIIGN